MKKNIVIGVLAIVIIIMGGSLLYLNSNKDKIGCDSKCPEAKKEEQIDTTNENQKEKTPKEANTARVEGIKNDYQIFSKNLKSQLSKYDDNNLNRQFVNNDNVRYPYTVYLNENGSLFVKYSNDELNNKYGDYKITDNALSFYVIETGNGGMSLLYFINVDGTIGSADVEFISDSNQITVKKDLGYKNIVSIVSGSFGDGYSGAQGPIFIDINGNIFSENLK